MNPERDQTREGMEEAAGEAGRSRAPDSAPLLFDGTQALVRPAYEGERPEEGGEAEPEEGSPEPARPLFKGFFHGAFGDRILVFVVVLLLLLGLFVFFLVSVLLAGSSDLPSEFSEWLTRTISGALLAALAAAVVNALVDAVLVSPPTASASTAAIAPANQHAVRRSEEHDGVTMYYNGEKYKGGWVEGRPHGMGTMDYDNGDVYQGGYAMGKRDGFGTCTWADGGTYEGGWKDGQTHGTGTYTWANCDKYEGGWKDGQKHDTGTNTWANGNKYEGGWKDDKKHGIGTFTWADGNNYEGGWKDGQKHGTGTYTWASGDKYEGEWKDGNMHGTGTFTWANGRVYVGEFEDHVKHGNGTAKEADSEDVCKVFYDYGKLVSSQRCGILIGGSPARNSRNTEVVDIVVLTDWHKKCQICFKEFSFDLSTPDGSIKRRLPVLSSCNHRSCHGCAVDRQLACAEESNGRVPTLIACMFCREKSALCPSKPLFDRQLIEDLSQSIPVMRERTDEHTGCHVKERLLFDVPSVCGSAPL